MYHFYSDHKNQFVCNCHTFCDFSSNPILSYLTTNHKTFFWTFASHFSNMVHPKLFYQLLQDYLICWSNIYIQVTQKKTGYERSHSAEGISNNLLLYFYVSFGLNFCMKTSSRSLNKFGWVSCHWFRYLHYSIEVSIHLEWIGWKDLNDKKTHHLWNFILIFRHFVLCFNLSPIFLDNNREH